MKFQPLGKSIFIGFIVMLSICWGQSNYSKIPFATYLMLPVSAEDEASAGVKPFFWNNPAATSDENNFVLGGYRNRFGVFNDEYIAGELSSGKWSAFSQLGITSVSDIEGRRFATSEPDYVFSANRANLLLGGNFKWKYFAIGLFWRHIYENLELRQFDANTFSGGLVFSYKNLMAGVSATDYGSNRPYFDYEYSPPTMYRAQIWYSYKFLSAGAGFFKPDMEKYYGAFAVEASPINWLNLRCSYTLFHDSRSFAFGTGFEWNKIGLNYALVLMGELGDVHSISLGYEF